MTRPQSQVETPVKGRTKVVMCGPAGWYAEVYEDSDDGSGYGDDPRVGYWFGTREQCEAVDPAAVTLHGVRHG